MGNPWLGTAVMILGIMVVLISALADVLGLGQPGFGQRQAVGIIIGMIVTWLGYRWRRRLTGSR